MTKATVAFGKIFIGKTSETESRPISIIWNRIPHTSDGVYAQIFIELSSFAGVDKRTFAIAAVLPPCI